MLHLRVLKHIQFSLNFSLGSSTASKFRPNLLAKISCTQINQSIFQDVFLFLLLLTSNLLKTLQSYKFNNLHSIYGIDLISNKRERRSGLRIKQISGFPLNCYYSININKKSCLDRL